MRPIPLLFTILAMASPASVLAQSLPGPATDGWFVLMGRQEGVENLGCVAVVRPAANAQGATVEPGPDNYFRLLITKRYGPYLRRDGKPTTDGSTTGKRQVKVVVARKRDGSEIRLRLYKLVGDISEMKRAAGET